MTKPLTLHRMIYDSYAAHLLNNVFKEYVFMKISYNKHLILRLTLMAVGNKRFELMIENADTRLHADSHCSPNLEPIKPQTSLQH